MVIAVPALGAPRMRVEIRVSVVVQDTDCHADLFALDGTLPVLDSSLTAVLPQRT